MLPHHPYCEQQFPNVEPLHVEPAVPAQVPSVETFLVAVGVGVAAFVLVLTVEAALTEETAPLPVQVPKPVWHPVPQ